MVDFALARRAMVDSQVSTSSVTDVRLLTAMGRVSRELFVPSNRRDLAYIDDHQPLGNGRFLPAPAIFARLVQLAGITPADTVLDVAAATGYATAILSALAKDVVGVESDSGLRQTATENLGQLGITNATIVDQIPDRRFDVILVEGGLEAQPDDLLALLQPGGRLAASIRRVATRFVLQSGVLKKETHFNATLPLLDREPRPDEFVF